jgi:Fe-S cluster assembly scaffold protein SufB
MENTYQLNALPVRTWRRLGLNGTDTRLTPPDIASAPACETVIPDGVLEATEAELVCAEFKSAVGDDFSDFVSANTNSGVRVRVPVGKVISEPVVVRYHGGSVVDDNIIVAEAGSEVTVVVIFDGDGDGRCYRGGRTRIIAENCANVSFVQIQTLSNKSKHMSDVSAIVGNGAHLRVTQLELGGESVVSGAHLKLEGDGGSANADTFYFGDGDRTLDFSYIARHLGRGTKSELTASGALFDRADKIYRGTLDFVRGAAESKGRETENTLLFSKDARNRSAPLILCGEEDIEGNHAASIGKMDEGKLYYMQSRGLSETDAKRLIVSAQMETVLKNVPGEALRDRLRDDLNERINSHEELR